MPEAKCREQSASAPAAHQGAGESASEGQSDACRRIGKQSDLCSLLQTVACVFWLQDLAELQKERQCVEKQHQQEVNKLNQELQQARSLHNALQAQADKVQANMQLRILHINNTRPASEITRPRLIKQSASTVETAGQHEALLHQALLFYQPFLPFALSLANLLFLPL